jgi:AraC family transcriptional regulator
VLDLQKSARDFGSIRSDLRRELQVKPCKGGRHSRIAVNSEWNIFRQAVSLNEEGRFQVPKYIIMSIDIHDTRNIGASQMGCSISQRKTPRSEHENPAKTGKRWVLKELETQSASALSAIKAFVREPSTRLYSSSQMGWDGVHLEHHRCFPVERRDSLSPQHVISVFTSHVSRGEISATRGRYVPYFYSPGEIKIYPAGPIGAVRPFTDTTMIVCTLDPKLVAEVGEEQGTPSTGELRPVLNLRDQALQGIVTLLAAEANSGGLSGKLYVEHLAHALALRFRLRSGGARVAGPSQPGKMPGRVLRRVLDRMKADFATDLDLKTIAAESGYSKSHFLRTFRASMGYSPHQWLTQLRIEEAKALLQKASGSLIEIGLDCGFSSHGHFSSTFRRIVGVTPREYRRDSKVTCA